MIRFCSEEGCLVKGFLYFAIRYSNLFDGCYFFDGGRDVGVGVGGLVQLAGDLCGVARGKS
jgi:hypothetical protein